MKGEDCSVRKERTNGDLILKGAAAYDWLQLNLYFLKFHDSHFINIVTRKYSVKFYFSMKLLPRLIWFRLNQYFKVASELLNWQCYMYDWNKFMHIILQ